MSIHYINTDAVSNSGRSFHDEWFSRGIAVLTDKTRYKDLLSRAKTGDTLLMFVKEKGLSAVGTVLEDEVEDVLDPLQMVSEREKVEYHKKVNWLINLKDNPIPWDTFVAITGQLPTAAMARVKAGGPAMRAYLQKLASAKTANPREYEAHSRLLLDLGAMQRPAGNQKPSVSNSSRREYGRDPAVRAWALYRAKGRCELCSKSAPFLNDRGAPYLEVHHIVPLAADGEDTPLNTAALCPNCHRELHHGASRTQQSSSLAVNILKKDP